MATIPAGTGLEVFVNEARTITIRQDADPQSGSDEDAPMVVIHPDDISALIRALENARRNVRRGGADKREEITVPAFVYPSRPIRSS
jgi:hypothetical protein